MIRDRKPTRPAGLAYLPLTEDVQIIRPTRTGAGERDLGTVRIKIVSRGRLPQQAVEFPQQDLRVGLHLFRQHGPDPARQAHEPADEQRRVLTHPLEIPLRDGCRVQDLRIKPPTFRSMRRGDGQAVALQSLVDELQDHVMRLIR